MLILCLFNSLCQVGWFQTCQWFWPNIILPLQVVLCITGFVLNVPMATRNMPVTTEKFVELLCNISIVNILLPLSFNFILLLLCAVFGFLTRKLPDNFNESWYIFISVITTIFIWIAFLTTNLLAFYAYHKAALLALALILNSFIVLICLFGPKIYAVYFVNEKDIKITNFPPPNPPTNIQLDTQL